jgi:branched-chain amino acid transport system substrate-binding protein
MRKRRVVVASTLTAGLLLAACGSSGSGTASGGAEGTSPSSASFESPLKLVFLWEVAGESSVAVDDLQNGAQMAVDEINANGGVGGRPIEATRIAASPLDPQATAAAFLQALDREPSAVIGFATSAQILASNQNIVRGGVPVLTTSSSNDLRYGSTGGTDFTWVVNTTTDGVTTSASKYMTEELGLSRIGLMGTNETFGTSSIASSKAALDALGNPSVAERTYAPTATDLTEPVLAMKDAGVDGVMNWGYPNPVAVQLKQFVQNGLNVPTMTGGSAPIIANNKLADGAALASMSAALPCNPPGSDQAALSAFAQEYQQKYGETAGLLSALAHDAVYVAAAAAEKAGSPDPAAINKALADVTVTDGVVCAPEYQADGGHFLGHQVVIAQWKADGSSSTVKTYVVDPTSKAGG